MDVINVPVVNRVMIVGTRDEWNERVMWCANTLHHGGHYEPNWYIQYPYLVFEDEQEYAWYMLRWG